MTRSPYRPGAAAWPLLTGLWLALTGCATPPPEPPTVPATTAPDAVIPGGHRRYPDERLQAYVQSVLNRLLRSAPKPRALRVTVTDDPGFMAIVTATDNVYISRGLLAMLQSEAELAAILAHEIAHRLAGHSRKTTSEARRTLGMSRELASRIGNRTGEDIARTFSRALFKAKLREQELEADRLSVEHLIRAGYEPQAAIDVLDMLTPLEHSVDDPPSTLDPDSPTHPIFRDHPAAGQRVEILRAQVRRTRNPLSPGTTGREPWLRAIDNLVFGGHDHHFIRRGDQLYLPPQGLALRMDHRWRLVLVTPGYLSFMSVDERFRLLITLEGEATEPWAFDFIQVLNRQNPVRKPQTVRIGAYRGYRQSGHLQVHRGRQRVDALEMKNGTKLLKMYMTAEESTSETELKRRMSAVVKSLRAMTATDRAHAKPLRLRIERARPGITFHQLAKDSPLVISPEGQLRLINRLLPFGEPKAGEPVKTIR